jgi:pimeloyl-ACP methyl ester carboxylesterase
MRRFLVVALSLLAALVALLIVNAVIVGGQTESASASDGRVLDLPGVGHTPQMERPAVAAALVRERDLSSR